MAENEIKKIKQVEVGDTLYDVAVKSVDHVDGLKEHIIEMVSSYGVGCTASGDYSHAEGIGTIASGKASRTGGIYTTAGYDYQTVVGQFNDNKENTLFEVGKGTGIAARSNALEVLADGRVKVYGTPTEDEDVIRKVDLATLSSSSTDETVTLAEDLYTYAPIGNAQKASNKVIGSGSIISTSNPGKLGDAGDTLKSVFNKLFGTETASQPTVNKSVSLSVSCDKSSITNSNELGANVGSTTATYTISLSNSATVSYGYKCGSTNTTGSKTIYYPATKAYNSNTAQVKITLPSNNTGDTKITMVSGTLVNSTTTDNILYCNFDTSKQVKFSVTLPAAIYTTSQQTRYGKVEAEVTLGNAQTENTNNATVTTTNANKIDAFLAYKPVSNAYVESTVSISGGTEEDYVSAITIAKCYVPYTWELATAAIAANGNLPTTNKQQTAITNISINNADGSKNLYIYVPSGKTIKAITNNTYSAPFTSDGSRTLKVNGQDATFNIYHVNAKVASGTNEFAITYN